MKYRSLKSSFFVLKQRTKLIIYFLRLSYETLPVYQRLREISYKKRTYLDILSTP